MQSVNIINKTLQDHAILVRTTAKMVQTEYESFRILTPAALFNMITIKAQLIDNPELLYYHFADENCYLVTYLFKCSPLAKLFAEVIDEITQKQRSFWQQLYRFNGFSLAASTVMQFVAYNSNGNSVPSNSIIEGLTPGMLAIAGADLIALQRLPYFWVNWHHLNTVVKIAIDYLVENYDIESSSNSRVVLAESLNYIFSLIDQYLVTDENWCRNITLKLCVHPEFNDLVKVICNKFPRILLSTIDSSKRYVRQGAFATSFCCGNSAGAAACFDILVNHQVLQQSFERPFTFVVTEVEAVINRVFRDHKYESFINLVKNLTFLEYLSEGDIDFQELFLRHVPPVDCNKKDADLQYNEHQNVFEILIRINTKISISSYTVGNFKYQSESFRESYFEHIIKTYLSSTVSNQVLSNQRILMQQNDRIEAGVHFNTRYLIDFKTQWELDSEECRDYLQTIKENTAYIQDDLTGPIAFLIDLISQDQQVFVSAFNSALGEIRQQVAALSDQVEVMNRDYIPSILKKLAANSKVIKIFTDEVIHGSAADYIHNIRAKIVNSLNAASVGQSGHVAFDATPKRLQFVRKIMVATVGAGVSFGVGAAVGVACPPVAPIVGSVTGRAAGMMTDEVAAWVLNDKYNKPYLDASGMFNDQQEYCVWARACACYIGYLQGYFDEVTPSLNYLERVDNETHAAFTTIIVASMPNFLYREMPLDNKITATCLMLNRLHQQNKLEAPSPALEQQAMREFSKLVRAKRRKTANKEVVSPPVDHFDKLFKRLDQVTPDTSVETSFSVDNPVEESYENVR